MPRTHIGHPKSSHIQMRSRGINVEQEHKKHSRKRAKQLVNSGHNFVLELRLRNNRMNYRFLLLKTTLQSSSEIAEMPLKQLQTKQKQGRERCNLSLSKPK